VVGFSAAARASDHRQDRGRFTEEQAAHPAAGGAGAQPSRALGDHAAPDARGERISATRAPEKVYEALVPHQAHAHEARLGTVAPNAQTLEDEKVASAIKTDFILSAEIMAITLAAIPEGSFTMRAVILAVVGIGITAVVYGAVALIVKADDLGVNSRPTPR
jgi:hypothetical protein